MVLFSPYGAVFAQFRNVPPHEMDQDLSHTCQKDPCGRSEKGGSCSNNYVGTHGSLPFGILLLHDIPMCAALVSKFTTH